MGGWVGEERCVAVNEREGRGVGTELKTTKGDLARPGRPCSTTKKETDRMGTAKTKDIERQEGSGSGTKRCPNPQSTAHIIVGSIAIEEGQKRRLGREEERR